ncbi:hypothetical protein CXT76_01175 [Candidatus Parvarchaeota archaeon]|jgi:hypothetical protein|nr:MAG: hypothetical protein CXT76_01175 [Candidatus Parvarchaeota archaeon]HIG51867.1 hypothetical protein [Candidatus Pacearchaeota archaeon]
MKKLLTFGLTFLIIGIFSLNFVSSLSCNLNAKLINQDPYPAIPGEYVDLVFQLNGVSNPECGNTYFELIEEYPINLDPGVGPSIEIISGTYSQDFSSHLLAPFKVRVDKDALDGENEISVRFAANYVSTSENFFTIEKFNLTVEDSRTDFEINIKDYSYLDKTIIFEILNIGKYDVEALTVDIIQQENILIKGSNRNIVGSLDSNEDTTFNFEAIPKEGSIILDISYNDKNNFRRTLQKTVFFDPTYFTDRAGEESGRSIWSYLFYLSIILVIYYFWKKRKAKK